MISAIVVNWNGRDYLPECLDALKAQDPPPDEIILADNHSDDGSRQWVAENHPDVRIADLGRNAGPGAARNRGVNEARHEKCLLLDNDVVLRPGALAALDRVLDSDPRTAVVQARSLFGGNPELVHYDAADLHFLGTLVLRNWFQPLSRASAPDGPVGAGIALCLLTRKSVFQEVGGFDERLFILYEDNEFSYKVRMRGHLVRLASDALCLHKAGTAGLSVRGEKTEYPGARTFLHSRNRWYVLLTCMHWRTLLLTVPAQLAYGMVYAAFGHRRGHVLDWWRGKWALLKLLPAAVRRRRDAQRGRTVPDRELLIAAPMTLNPGLADRGFSARVRIWLDRFFSVYWRAVRRLCG